MLAWPAGPHRYSLPPSHLWRPSHSTLGPVLPMTSIGSVKSSPHQTTTHHMPQPHPHQQVPVYVPHAPVAIDSSLCHRHYLHGGHLHPLLQIGGCGVEPCHLDLTTRGRCCCFGLADTTPGREKGDKAPPAKATTDFLLLHNVWVTLGILGLIECTKKSFTRKMVLPVYVSYTIEIC